MRAGSLSLWINLEGLGGSIAILTFGFGLRGIGIASGDIRHLGVYRQ